MPLCASDRPIPELSAIRINSNGSYSLKLPSFSSRFSTIAMISAFDVSVLEGELSFRLAQRRSRGSRARSRNPRNQKQRRSSFEPLLICNRRFGLRISPTAEAHYNFAGHASPKSLGERSLRTRRVLDEDSLSETWNTSPPFRPLPFCLNRPFSCSGYGKHRIGPGRLDSDFRLDSNRVAAP